MRLLGRERETEAGPDDGDDDETAVDEPAWPVSAWDSKPVQKQLLSPWLPLELATWHTDDAWPLVHHILTVDRPSAHAPAGPSRWPEAAATSTGEPAPAASERFGYCEERAWLRAEEDGTTVVAVAAADVVAVVVADGDDDDGAVWEM